MSLIFLKIKITAKQKIGMRINIMPIEIKNKFDIFETADPLDPKDIAKKINYILDNKERFIELKKNSKKIFNEELNFENQFEKSYKIFLGF